MLAQYAYKDYPAFAPSSHSDNSPNTPVVPQGYLTPNGQTAAKLLGSYFREYLLREGLLTGDPTTDLSHSYFRANSIQRSNITAAKFGEGLIQVLSYTTIPVHSYPLGNPDPVFDPIATSLAMVPAVDLHLDPDLAVQQAVDKYGSGAALAIKYSDDLSLISQVLYSQTAIPKETPLMPPGTLSPPIPPALQYPKGSLDPTTQSFTLKPNSVVPIPPPATLSANAITQAGGIIDVGGLGSTNTAADTFVLQYADNFLLKNVAWQRLNLSEISQTTQLVTLQIDIEMRLPYVSQVQSSNAASHVLRTMSQARYGSSGASGVFGDDNSEIKVITSSDYYVAGLAGLLDLTWTLPGYQKDYIPPDGTIVFELRKSKISKDYLVRAFYYAQSFDQLRNQTPLSLIEPPEREQLKFGSLNEISFDDFNTLLSQKIDPRYVDPFSQVSPPPVCTLCQPLE